MATNFAPPESANVARFGAGLTEAEVRRFQGMLQKQCGRDVSLGEAWSRAIATLSLVEALLVDDGMTRCPQQFALPRT